MLFVGVLQIPIWAIWHIYNHRNLGFKKSLTEVFSTKNWGPAPKKLREEWQRFKEEKNLNLQENRSIIKRIFDVR